MHEKKPNEGSKLEKCKRWVSHVVALWKRPKIKAYFFPKDGPPYPIELPYSTLTPMKSRKRRSMQTGYGTQPPAPVKPRPRKTFFEKLKGFFFRRG